MTLVGNGFFTVVPRRCENPIPLFASFYQEFLDDGIAIHYQDHENLECNFVEVLCPLYAQRLFAFYNTAHHCMSMHYDTGLVKFMLGDNVVDEDTLFNSITLNQWNEDVDKKEKILRDIATLCLKTNFNPMYEMTAASNGVLDGYNIIRGIFHTDQ